MQFHLVKRTCTVVAALLWQSGAAAAGASAVTSVPLQSAQTVYFTHRDRRLLVPGQQLSSVAYLADASDCDQELPLLVLLHGINESMTLYPWFGGTHDLRPMLNTIARRAQRPFVVAAPTQTKNAWISSTLWKDFSVGAFFDDLAKALPQGCRVDRQAVFAAGHSAAGCNANGGLATILEEDPTFPLAGVAFIDTCFDPKVAEGVAARRKSSKIWVLWQDRSWPRSPQTFIDRLEVYGRAETGVTPLQLVAPNPHVGAMYASVEMIVTEWLLAPAVDRETPRRSVDPRSKAEDDTAVAERAE